MTDIINNLVSHYYGTLSFFYDKQQSRVVFIICIAVGIYGLMYSLDWIMNDLLQDMRIGMFFSRIFRGIITYFWYCMFIALFMKNEKIYDFVTDTDRFKYYLLAYGILWLTLLIFKLTGHYINVFVTLIAMYMFLPITLIVFPFYPTGDVLLAKKFRYKSESYGNRYKAEDFSNAYRSSENDAYNQQSYSQGQQAAQSTAQSFSKYFGGITNPADLKKKYRELAKRLHPDVNGGSDKAFKEMENEYERKMKGL